MKKYLLSIQIVSIMLAFMLVSSMANAQKTASVSGNWNNIATWGGAAIPTSSDDVIINNGVTVTINVANAQCKSITIGNTDAQCGVTISGTNSLTVTNAVTIGNLLDNSSGVDIAVGDGNFSCASLTMANVTFSNDDIALTIASGTATISGSLTMNGTGAENLVNITGAGKLNVGSLSLTNGTVSLSGTSTVNYTGGTQTIRAEAYNNLTLSGSGAKTVTGIDINGTLSMQGTATATGTSPNFGGASKLEYAGSAAQTTSSVEYPASNGPRSLIINNSNGVTLHAARSVIIDLTLTSGLLNTTATNVLNVLDNGTVTGGSDNSFINGPLEKTGNDAFTFPVGVAGQGIRPISISAPGSVNSVFTAEFKKVDPHTLSNTLGAGLVNISACEYWTLSNSGTASNLANVVLSWSANSCNGASYVGNLSSLRVSRLSASTWVDLGNASTTGSLTVGTATSNASPITAFGSFVLATSSVNNPLPVMFADIKGYQKNNGVQIEWSNLTERDLTSYVVERSSNGSTYTEIAQQAPRSNYNDKQSYTSFDATPSMGINYYRVKVLEINGKVIYSKVIKVDIAKTAQGFSLYPNPVKGNTVSVSLNNKAGQYNVKISTNSGQQVYNVKFNHQGGSMTQTIELPSSVKPGVYNIVISGDNYREAKMFVVQ